MNWAKAIGYGVGIWVLMFVIISIFVAFKLTGMPGMGLIDAILAAILAVIAASMVKIDGVGKALLYGLVWAVVGIILDYFISTKFASDIFSSMWYWLGYVLILLAPLTRIKKELRPAV